MITKFGKVPFHIGVTHGADNPHPLPNRVEFNLCFDERLGLVRQVTSSDLARCLADAYELGVHFGTPLSHDGFGRSYADDFLEFARSQSANGKRALEIGAGTGYLMRRLMESGFDVTGLEPGRGYERYQRMYQVRVLRERFPCPSVQGKFDLVVLYGVLEHLEDPVDALVEASHYLTDEGRVVISVPDCTAEIVEGDFMVLTHEHISYFDETSLRRVFDLAGLQVKIQRSSFGRQLYAAGWLGRPTDRNQSISITEEARSTFPERAHQRLDNIRNFLVELADLGTLGIYVPGRALWTIDESWDLHFYDDDPALRGLYYPPFRCRVESMQNLIEEPVTSLLVCSRTFGSKIIDQLQSRGYRGSLFSAWDLGL